MPRLYDCPGHLESENRVRDLITGEIAYICRCNPATGTVSVYYPATPTAGRYGDLRVNEYERLPIEHSELNPGCEPTVYPGRLAAGEEV